MLVFWSSDDDIHPLLGVRHALYVVLLDIIVIFLHFVRRRSDLVNEETRF